MSPQALLVMILWFPTILLLFTRFNPQRAVIICFIVAWLFLPQRAGFSIPGFPDYDRISATCYGIFLATLIFDSQRFRSFKFGWLDVPILILCIVPFFSSMANDLGAYDGLSASLDGTVKYGFPYFLGRIYLTNFSSLKKLVIAIFISGLIYAPLCLYEVKMSPQLHRIVYGYLGNPSFAQSIRLGGYRPTVFMRHGLSVSMWMMAATLIGIWLWQSGMLKKLWNIPMTWLIAVMMITFILIKSTGAYVYLFYGLVILFTAKWFRNAIPLLFLIACISFYLFLGATGNFAGKNADQVISFISQIVPPERVQSLQFRFDNEELLVQKAMKKPIFGWGGWGRSRVFDYNYADELVDVSVTDSLWIISYGTTGAVGLISIFATSLLPSFAFVLRYPARIWFHPQVAPAAIVAIILPLYMLDGTMNNQFNPVFMVMSGALSGFVLSKANPTTRRVISTQTKRNLADNTNLI